tara:strand:- start:72 stop:422 length:351 start_codon:yes stop_codon:yes gene_type:complete
MTIKKNLIKMLLIFWFVMVIGSLFGGFSLLAQAEDQKGEMLALSCTSCHGTHGLSPGAMPTLFGKSLKYLEQSMQEFKYDQRAATVMQRIAKGYTLEEIRLISEYFASLYTEKGMK